MIRSVRSRLIVLYIIFIGIIFIIFSSISISFFRSTLMKNNDALLLNARKNINLIFKDYYLEYSENSFNLIKNSYSEEGDLFKDELDEEIEELLLAKTVYAQLSLIDTDSMQLKKMKIKSSLLEKENKEIPVNFNLKDFLKKGVYFETDSKTFIKPVRILSSKLELDGRSYLLQIAVSIDNIDNLIKTQIIIYILLLPVLILISFLAGIIFVRHSFSPIRNMINHANNISAHNLSLRIEDVRSRDEIGALADTLNNMISRLDSSFKEIKQFSGDVSHELKTPIAKIKLNTEITLRKERTNEEYKKALLEITEDADGIQSIVENLLFLSKIDSNDYIPFHDSFILNSLVLEIFEELDYLMKKKKLSLNLNNFEEGAVVGDRHLIKIMIKNIILNAIHYSYDNQSIDIDISKSKEYLTLYIRDRGIGISKEEQEQIFKRFYRVDSSRNRDTGGSGLGLSIVKKIAELHNTSINVESIKDKGSSFIIKFKIS